MKIRTNRFGRAVLAASLASVSVPALAQEAAVPEDDTAQENQSSGENEAIVVTGSRLITDGSNSPTQVAVVTTEEMLLTTPTSIADGLQKLPQFATLTDTSNQTGGSSVSTFLNLRSIGSVRNLVLFDGTRLVPSSTNGSVDVNTIPQMLIQRVDVVTGGVSAVYGSDAVSGVVNFIVDRKFDGLKALAQAGISQRGDAAHHRIGIAGGTDFAGGRGHVIGSFEYSNNDGIPSNKDRKNGAARYTATGAGTAANPFRLTSDSRMGALYSFGGHVVATQDASGANIVTRFTDTNFSSDGVLTPFRHGTPTGSSGIESGGEGGYYESPLRATLRTKQGFLRADYALSDNVNVHVQGIYTDADTSGTAIHHILGPLTVSASNGFLPTALRNDLAAAGVSTFTLRKFVDSQPYVRQETNTRNIYGNIGFDGKFGSNFEWSVNYAHNETRRKTTTLGNGNVARIAASIDGVLAPDSYTGSNFLLNSEGQRVVCQIELVNPALFPGCLPTNAFGPTAEDSRAVAWTRGTTRNVLTQKLDAVTATLAGTLFNLPAGEVRLALNGEYREQRLVGVSTNQPSARANCAGLRLNNCTAVSSEWRQGVSADARGKVNVKEIGGEILIPILADSAVAQALNFSGAARYTDYSTSGGVETWKVGLDWHLNDDLRLRGTLSRDIRAPTVFELFGPQQLGRSGFDDILTGRLETVLVLSGGNENLVPEKADTFTLGAVYKPGWLPGFSVAIDYFDIRISDAITAIDGRTAAVQRQCIDSNFTSSVCSLYTRPISPSDTSPANFPTQVTSANLNVADVRTKGVDVDMIYRKNFLGGDWKFRLVGTYQPKYTQVNLPGELVLNNAGADGLPKYRATAFIGYSSGPISIDTQTTWHSSTKYTSNPNIVYDFPDTAAKAFTDLTLTYDVDDGLTGSSNQFFLSINNVFDTAPAVFPMLAGVPGYGLISTNGDDYIGRAFTFGYRGRF